MSVRNGIVLFVVISTLLFLAACGGNGSSITNPVPPPSGSFSNSSLNGTYVFSLSGTDIANGTPYAMVGSLTANGSGRLSGVVDINDTAFATDYSTVVPPLANGSISNGSYSVTVDGRGQAKFNTSNPVFGSITLDFVLSSGSQGLITELDGIATGSGTLDSQTAGTTPTGTYAFSFSGADFSNGGAYATVGNFTLGAGNAIAGLEDFNVSGFAYADQALTGQFVLGPSSSPSTSLSTAQFGALTFDVYAINSSHLKFIEMDSSGTFTGDAFSQSTPTISTTPMAFTLEGIFPANAAFAAGGFMTANGSGAITGSEDVNESGSTSPSSLNFTANYSVANGETGRYTLSGFSGFTGGATYVAYPSSGGLLLLEMDDSGITAGAAYPQTAGATFAASSQGYALNLSGFNISASGEVDDIAEFTANPTGGTVTGLIDENSDVSTPTFDQVLSGTFGTISSGRYGISASAGTNNVVGSLNGGFALTLYTVDGTTFPFIESDGGQVSAGVIVQQNPSASSAAIAHPSMFVMHPLIRPHAAKQKKN
jgi:hypothetical protein